MKVLQIGLGSMGKRRIRCLNSLGIKNIVGLDNREDRRREVEKLYKIETVSSLDEVSLQDFDFYIISTPPDTHIEYLKLAIAYKKASFVEASVLLEELEEIKNQADFNNVLIAPSCTLRFHPAIKEIKKIVEDKKYGEVTNFTYHSGQYLPDWHPWEKVKDFYVSKRKTGGGREIVPFELTWIHDVFGFPTHIKGLYGHTMDVGAQIDDTYAVTVKFKQGFGAFVVDVVARNAIRKLSLNFERGQLLWSWDKPYLEIYNVDTGLWEKREYKVSDAFHGYNKNIIEDMYIEEVDRFISAAKGEGVFPNSLEDDISVLKLLYKIEEE